MALVVRSPRAEADLTALALRFGRASHRTAYRFLDAARAAFDQLAAMPEIGGLLDDEYPQLAGLRAWPVGGFENYLVVYRVVAGTVEVARVVYGGRDLGALDLG